MVQDADGTATVAMQLPGAAATAIDTGIDVAPAPAPAPAAVSTSIKLDPYYVQNGLISDLNEHRKCVSYSGNAFDLVLSTTASASTEAALQSSSTSVSHPVSDSTTASVAASGWGGQGSLSSRVAPEEARMPSVGIMPTSPLRSPPVSAGSSRSSKDVPLNVGAAARSKVASAIGTITTDATLIATAATATTTITTAFRTTVSTTATHTLGTTPAALSWSCRKASLEGMSPVNGVGLVSDVLQVKGWVVGKWPGHTKDCGGCSSEDVSDGDGDDVGDILAPLMTEESRMSLGPLLRVSRGGSRSALLVRSIDPRVASARSIRVPTVYVVSG